MQHAPNVDLKKHVREVKPSQASCPTTVILIGNNLSLRGKGKVLSLKRKKILQSELYGAI
jgi:hypothetical protein